PFWRDAGWSGEAVSDGDLLSVTYDNSTHDGRVAALVGFIVGAAARAWSERDRAARQRAVLAQLAGWFGPEAAAPLAYEDVDWSAEPWSGGCPVSNPAPGVLTSAAATLAAPLACLHFAGTETASEWIGYMEGAVQSGLRAAAEIGA
ncbi:MAG: FAD-dependent oxidoreductase, partial [Deltaproteobacteria bacterium]|nr:FAD-dependent oxidoreductase [Deltaproteobacteria bacterium]